MNSITIDVDKQAILEKVGRMFDQSPSSVLLEILQNARRAGAKSAEITLGDGFVSIANDGRVMTPEDWHAMFHLGSTGWKGETLSEDPAGCGFFVASLYDEVIMRSGNKQLTVTKDRLTKLGEELELEHKEFPGHEYPTRITLKGSGPRVDKREVTSVARELEMDVRLVEKVGEDSQLLDNFHRYMEREIDRGAVEYLGMHGSFEWYYLDGRYNLMSSSGDLVLNYHGHVCRLDVCVYTGRRARQGSLVARVVRPTDLRLVLPGRHSLVDNEAKEDLIMLARKVNGDRLEKMDEHRLTYDAYKYVKATNPDLKEALPSGWADELAENPDKTGLVTGWYYVPTMLTHCFEEFIEVRDYTHFSGYSWASAVSDRVFGIEDLHYRLDGGEETLCVCLPEYEGDESVARFDKIELMANGKVIFEPRFLLLTDDGSVMTGPSVEHHDPFLALSKDLVGEELADAMDALRDSVACTWEPNDDVVSLGNCESQHTAFFSELNQWLDDVVDPGSGILSVVSGWLEGNYIYWNVPLLFGANEDKAVMRGVNTPLKAVDRIVVRKDPKDMLKKDLVKVLGKLKKEELADIVSCVTKVK